MSYQDGAHLQLPREEAYERLQDMINKDKVTVLTWTDQSSGKCQLSFRIHYDNLLDWNERFEIFDLFLRSAPLIIKEHSFEELEVEDDDFAAALARAASPVTRPCDGY